MESGHQLRRGPTDGVGHRAFVGTEGRATSGRGEILIGKDIVTTEERLGRHRPCLVCRRTHDSYADIHLVVDVCSDTCGRRLLEWQAEPSWIQSLVLVLSGAALFGALVVITNVVRTWPHRADLAPILRGEISR